MTHCKSQLDFISESSLSQFNFFFALFRTVDKLEIEALYQQFQVLADALVAGGAISRAAFQYCLGPFGHSDAALSDTMFKVVSGS